MSTVKRRGFMACAARLTGLAGATTAPGLWTASAEAAGEKVLRYAFLAPESTFDPPSTNSDFYSSTLISQILEAPLTYDYLARPVRLIPNTAQALPQISADGLTITLRIRPGIYFADDAAFKGSPRLDAQGRRELTAEDYVYSIKRFFDPQYASSDLYLFEAAKMPGMAALRERALKTRRPFDYDTPVAGLCALDRYTLRIQMGEADPRWYYNLAAPALTGAVAREVVEFYGKDIGAHPVGTGPFRLAQWRRASRIELVKSPSYRRRVYEGTPSDDPVAQAIAQQLKGRTLPCVDRIVVDVVEEAQPRWLTFVQGGIDWMVVPSAFVPLAVPGGQLAPFLQKKGVRLQTELTASMSMHYFSMDDPVVGGYTPDRVALRRAIAMAYDGPSDIRLLRNGMAIPAQSTLVPHTVGYDDDYRSEMSSHDPARAKALLDVYGYTDRDGDGFRERPNGKPLVLRIASLGTQADRAANELWKRCLNAVGLRVEFEVSTWPELLKKTRTGALQIWGYSWSAQSPDGGFYLSIAYGPNSGDANDARFSWPAFDRLYEQQRRLPDGPQRLALMRQAKDLLVAYMPYKVHRHEKVAWLQQPWLRHFWAHPFMRDTWQYLDTERVGV
ncbi:MAG: bicyclomycin resistance protein [Betaproteobacteria bacterium]|nr:bicyclomycin resistance protein [Betaproteobacteria bacterium]